MGGLFVISCFIIAAIAHRLYITCGNDKTKKKEKTDDDLEKNDDSDSIENQLHEDIEKCATVIEDNCKTIHKNVIEKLNELKKQFDQHLLSEKIFGKPDEDKVVENNYVEVGAQTEDSDDLTNEVIVDFTPEDEMGSVDVTFTEKKSFWRR